MKSGMVISGIRGMGNTAAVGVFGADAETALATGVLFAVFACSFSAEQALNANTHSVYIHVFEVDKSVI